MFLTYTKWRIFKQTFILKTSSYAMSSLNKVNIDLQLLIFLLFPGEMLLVSFQKSCMKKLNPDPRGLGKSVPV